MTREARVTSKGQITVPRDVRRALGIGPGDTLLFEDDGKRFHVRAKRRKSPFAKFRGIGNPGIPSGRKAILRYFRRLRGR